MVLGYAFKFIPFSFILLISRCCFEYKIVPHSTPFYENKKDIQPINISSAIIGAVKNTGPLLEQKYISLGEDDIIYSILPTI